RLGQGRESAKQFFRDNPELVDELKTKVLVAKGLIEEEAD
ncbi:MAG: recombinase RecA, partial [Planctomycetota bacterium]